MKNNQSQSVLSRLLCCKYWERRKRKNERKRERKKVPHSHTEAQLWPCVGASVTNPILRLDMYFIPMTGPQIFTHKSRGHGASLSCCSVILSLSSLSYRDYISLPYLGETQVPLSQTGGDVKEYQIQDLSSSTVVCKCRSWCWKYMQDFTLR